MGSPEARRRWWREHPTETLPETAVADPTGPVADRQLLERALSVLTARQRAVVVLRYRLDRAGTKRDVVRLPGSALDGLEVDAGGLLASSNDTASVYRVDRRGRVSTTLTGLVAPAADFSLDRQRRRLLVPMVAANRLELRDLR